MKSKKYYVYSLILIFIFIVTGCGDYGDIVTQTPIDSNDNIATSENKSEIVDNFDGLEILVNRTYTLNPLLSNDERLCKVLNLLYHNIISYDENNKVTLNLIESYVFDSTSNTYEIVIKPNMLWDDGEVIDANDFIYSYNLLLGAPENVYYKPVISNVKSFVKVSNSKIKVTVNSAKTGNPYFLAFPVVPEHEKDNEPMADDVHLNLVVGNGYYSNAENTVNNEIILRDNQTDTYNAEIDNVKLVVVDDEETIYYGFEQNISNVLSSTVSDWSKYHVSKSVNISSYNNMVMTTLGFNFETKINNDINFRNSVYYSIPFEQIISSIYLDYCNPSRLLLPNSHFAYNTSIVSEEFDPTKAEEYLLKTSYGGNELKLITVADNNELKKICEILKNNLEIINVNVKIVELPFDEYKNAIDSGDYDLYVGKFKMSVLPDYNKIIGENNYSNYNNSALTEYLNNLNDSKSYEEYQTTSNVIQNIVFTEKPIIPIVHNHDAIISNENYLAVKPTSYNTPYQNIIKWTKNK